MKVLRLTTLFVIAAVLAVACAAPAASRPPTSPTTPTTTTTPTQPPPSPSLTAVSDRVAVTLTDTMRIEPASMTVPAGKPITFVVTNAGSIAHEFTLGDADIQDEHEQEMMEMGGMPMAHDEDNAISVEPGKTKELVFTFDKPGTSLAGCHVPGHYPAGMKATIMITG